MVRWTRLGNKITKEDIEYIEEETGLKLPKDYVACVLKHNGGRPYPSTTKDDYIVHNLYSLSKQDSFPALYAFRERYKSEFQGLLFPFAGDPGGNEYCFKYGTKNDTEPVVVFCDHETLDVEYVASNFTELLNMLVKSD